MPTVSMRSSIAIRGSWMLLILYVLLALSLQPLLLEHVFAAGSAHEHSDQDVCAWLDHAASAGLQSIKPPASLLQCLLASPLPVDIAFPTAESFFDPIRGPPLLS
ncbi:conserved protein of unknown function [Nitrospira japonica]|uniref:Uncharacterized protein n=1 Tax=Nitrospira japonica TaxID=1325564 RepID=A0A1W1I4X0_9BACT|nr:conserved protein of unknown function [Nitrospira japonica]